MEGNVGALGWHFADVQSDILRVIIQFGSLACNLQVNMTVVSLTKCCLLPLYINSYQNIEFWKVVPGLAYSEFIWHFVTDAIVGGYTLLPFLCSKR